MQVLERDAESHVQWRCTVCGTLEAVGGCDGFALHIRIPKLRTELFYCDECDRIWHNLEDLLSPTYSDYTLFGDFLAAHGLENMFEDVEIMADKNA